MVKLSGKEVLSSPANRPIVLFQREGVSPGHPPGAFWKREVFAYVHRDIIHTSPARTPRLGKQQVYSSLCALPHVPLSTVLSAGQNLFLSSETSLMSGTVFQIPVCLTCPQSHLWYAKVSSVCTPEISAGQMRREFNLLV